jgi:hypothetical protein
MMVRIVAKFIDELLVSNTCFGTKIEHNGGQKVSRALGVGFH